MMEINSDFGRGKKADVVFYYLEERSQERNISKQQADGVFAAEKIRKDY